MPRLLLLLPPLLGDECRQKRGKVGQQREKREEVRKAQKPDEVIQRVRAESQLGQNWV